MTPAAYGTAERHAGTRPTAGPVRGAGHSAQAGDAPVEDALADCR